MEEVWKDIPQYYGDYEVSSLGRVRNKEGKIIPQYNTEKGYQRVFLKRPEWVHRLVAFAFIPNPENKPQVDHIDCCRANNEVTNLRWVTQSENNLNPITNKKLRDSYTSERRKKLSEQMKENNKKIKRLYGEENTFSKKYKGTHYYNNGVTQGRFHEGEQPDGWVRGGLPK